MGRNILLLFYLFLTVLYSLFFILQMFFMYTGCLKTHSLFKISLKKNNNIVVSKCSLFKTCQCVGFLMKYFFFSFVKKIRLFEKFYSTNCTLIWQFVSFWRNFEMLINLLDTLYKFLFKCKFIQKIFNLIFKN